MNRKSILFFVLGCMVIFTTCNKPVCPEPKPNQFITPTINISSCDNTAVPLKLTSCTQTLLTCVNRLLYARTDIYNGVSHRNCPDAEKWLPNEVNYTGANFHLFTEIDDCGSGINTPQLTHIFVRDVLVYEYQFDLFNAKEDKSFSYYGYCLPLDKYRGHQEYDSGQHILFYCYTPTNELVYIPKKNMISIKSINLDCNYINNYSATYSSTPYFLNSSFGIEVEIEVIDLPGISSGRQIIKGYVKSVTGLSGDFGGWVSTVFWKEEM